MQAGSIPCNQKFSCKWILTFLKAVLPSRLPFYLGSLLLTISSLSSHFRSWDYPENVGIYSQLDRRSKSWYFTFLNVYVSWIEWDKILISQLSPPKFMYFADQNGITQVGSHENEFWQFSNTRMNITNRAQKVDEKWRHLSHFLFSFLSYDP